MTKEENRIAALASEILSSTIKLDDYLNSHGLPTPSFDEDGPVQFGIAPDRVDVEAARVKAIEAALELVDLLQGPMALLRPLGLSNAGLQAISRFDIASKVPIGGEISYAELAKRCDVYEPDLRRLLRFAMVYHRLFREPRKGYVAHTAASKRLAEEACVRDCLWLMGDQLASVSTRIVDALVQFKSQEPEHTAYTLTSGSGKGFYGDFEEQPEIAAKFANAMISVAQYPSHPRSGPRTRLLQIYPWESLGNATVVDMGGARGIDSFQLAGAFPNLKFIVQDLPNVIEGAEHSIPPPLKDRVKFAPHDFFESQTVTADAYLIKQCFHNWPDHYCVTILKALIPALKPGARLIISDSIVPEYGTMTELAERAVRAFDLMMMASTNGREREKEDWIAIFKDVDARFKVTRLETYGRAGEFAPSNGVIEAVWRG